MTWRIERWHWRRWSLRAERFGGGIVPPYGLRLWIGPVEVRVWRER